LTTYPKTLRVVPPLDLLGIARIREPFRAIEAGITDPDSL
jgi:hypothetical protein